MPSCASTLPLMPGYILDMRKGNPLSGCLSGFCAGQNTIQYSWLGEGNGRWDKDGEFSSDLSKVL